MIRQWAQLRFGVFDEISVNNIENGDFYLNGAGELDVNRCSMNRSGKLRDAYSLDGTCLTFLPNGLPDSNCIFEDDIADEGVNESSGSLMYKSFLPQVSLKFEIIIFEL